jgi:hypothetical protein
MRLRQTYLYSSDSVSLGRERRGGQQEGYLYFGMVWSNTETHQTVGRRQGLIHVDASIWHLLQHAIGSVEACRA